MNALTEDVARALCGLISVALLTGVWVDGFGAGLVKIGVIAIFFRGEESLGGESRREVGGRKEESGAEERDAGGAGEERCDGGALLLFWVIAAVAGIGEQGGRCVL